MRSAVDIFKRAAENFLAVAASNYPDAIEEAVNLITNAFGTGHKLMVFGNGGSAADAEHICAEFAVRFARDRRALPAIALTANTSTLTACANDYGYGHVFRRQIEAFGKTDDIAWGLSTSGNSQNVIAALEYARASGLKTIGLTGAGGGKMREHCDVLLAAPHADTARIQEIHLLTYHIICAEVEERLARAGHI